MLKEYISEQTKERIIETLATLLDLTADSISAISLVGSGLFIILKVVGYDSGFKKAGILFTINVLVKYFLG